MLPHAPVEDRLGEVIRWVARGVGGGRLNPVILLFVLDCLAFLFCGWRRHAQYRRCASS